MRTLEIMFATLADLSRSMGPFPEALQHGLNFLDVAKRPDASQYDCSTENESGLNRRTEESCRDDAREDHGDAGSQAL